MWQGDTLAGTVFASPILEELHELMEKMAIWESEDHSAPHSLDDPSQLSWVFTCEARGLRVLKVLSSSAVFMSLSFIFLSSLIDAEMLSHPSPQEADFRERNPHSRAGRRVTHLPRAVF